MRFPSGERALIEHLKRTLGTDLTNDGAQLSAPDTHLVLTTDMLLEGSCFTREMGLFKVGRKAIGVNLSDLAAMAARPCAALVSLALPRSGGGRIGVELMEGVHSMAEEYRIPILGGDTNSWEGPIAISIAALGSTSGAEITRSGARPGDVILVTGSLGGSIVRKHLEFSPRVDEALLLRKRCSIHAMIDLSDGLVRDLAHVTEASGVGATLEAAAIPISEDALNAGSLSDPLTRALYDGEDFELLFCLSPTEAQELLVAQPFADRGVPITAIGGINTDPGIRIREYGSIRPLNVEGFEHQFT